MSRVLLGTVVFALALASLLAAPTATSSAKYQYTSCHIDSDGDGIADCYETNTGVYVSPTDTGTDPANPDTDGDGLSDGDEVFGTAGGLNLPSFGVSPVHKDILLEYDWMEDSTECAFHSHKPTVAMVNAVAAMFASAPVTNPDGTTGIHVYQDLAPSANPNTASNKISDADGIINGFVGGPDYNNDEAANFPANRKHYFHYVIFAHEYTGNPPSTGDATVGGYKMLVSLHCSYNDVNETSKTIAHELGHNLYLNHGGPKYVGTVFNQEQSCNYKPNYNSIMNYRFTFTGVANCSMQTNYVADFSRGTRRTLDENNVYEPNGVCTLADNPSGPTPIDWNSNGVIDQTPYVWDLNPQDPYCQFHVLHDFDDWGNIHLDQVTQTSTDVSE